MKRDIDIREISDGRKYYKNDMVRAGCNGCKGCFQCCTGMGDSIRLDPYDVYRIAEGLQISFQQMLEHYLELRVVDAVIQPNLKFTETDTCPFLNEAGRCNIHEFRPGFCRMFPLGRAYESDGFYYILQTHECPMPNKTKVRVSNWLGLKDDMAFYEEFIYKWHTLMIEVGTIVEESEQEKANRITMAMLQTFYVLPFDATMDFNIQFQSR